MCVCVYMPTCVHAQRKKSTQEKHMCHSLHVEFKGQLSVGSLLQSYGSHDWTWVVRLVLKPYLHSYCGINLYALD